MKHFEIWSEDRIVRLTEMWKKGTTPKTIAEVFGLTINAIETKANALNLGEQPVIRIKETQPQNRDQPRFCLWPDAACSAPTQAGKPYCAEHSREAYVPRDISRAAMRAGR